MASSFDFSQHIPEVSAAIAFVAAVAAWGSLLVQRGNTKRTIKAQVEIAARQSRASVVSASRQRWIDSIRDDIAEFLSTEDAFKSLRYRESMTRAGQEAILVDEQTLVRTRLRLRKRIELRLNPAKEHHQALLQALDRHMETTVTEPALETELLSKTKALLKDEWERVKREAAGTEPLSTPTEL